MDTESKIELELQAATKIVQKKNEDPQKYLLRLMLAVTKLLDPEWEALSTESQEWVNCAAEIARTNKTDGLKFGDKGYKELEDFPDFEDVVDIKEDDDVNEEATVDNEEEPVKPKKEKPQAKQEAKSEKAETSSGAPRKVSACHMIKKLVVKKPKITVAELSEKLKADGLKVSDVTIATLRSDLRDTLRVMNELKLGEFVL